MKNIAIIGAGHVGLVTAACFTDLGNSVICVDNDLQKISNLKNGILPFYEPGLAEIVDRATKNNRLIFTEHIREAVRDSEVVFIAVGTPQKPNGEPNLTAVEHVAKEVGEGMDGYRLVVEKSTVPVKTARWIESTIRLGCAQNTDFDVASNPEFLREGSAINDFMKPDRIVIGVDTERATTILQELYAPLNAPIVITTPETAELIKHASNAFLTLKISYINAIANICELVGADVEKVAEGMGYDSRIGRSFLNAGIGYGGYCFPKDIAAFIRIAEEAGYEFKLLKVVQEINEYQRWQIVAKAKKVLWNLHGKSIGVLGLAYKPDTDDVREAPSREIIRLLQEEGAQVKAYDPQAIDNAKEVLEDVEYCADAYEAANGSDALMILTEWEEFKSMDLLKVKNVMNRPVIIDGRNIYSSDQMEALGFTYMAVGK